MTVAAIPMVLLASTLASLGVTARSERDLRLRMAVAPGATSADEWRLQ